MARDMLIALCRTHAFSTPVSKSQVTENLLARYEAVVFGRERESIDFVVYRLCSPAIRDQVADCHRTLSER